MPQAKGSTEGTSGIYCATEIARHGLGNRLLTWARCLIFSVTNGIPMLAPHWATIPLGTVLRRELDLRTYHNLFTSAAYEVRGARAVALRLFARQIQETATLEEIRKHRASAMRPMLVMFRGWIGQFAPLIGWHELIRDRLTAMTRSRWLEAANSVPAAPIGIHVRGGDLTKQGIPIPIGWFSAALSVARGLSTNPLEAILVSDARVEELDVLLALPDVRLVRTGSAVSDLLALSRCGLILGSSYSTFSAWAAFLGQKPIFSGVAEGMTSLGVAHKDLVVGHLSPEAPSPAFKDAVRRVSQ